MDARELRIGNWYNWYAEGKYYEFQVEAIDLIQNFVNFEPITLTEDWLRKLGFKYTPSGAGGQDQWAGYGFWSLNHIHFLGNKKGDFLYYNRDEKIKILFVHRLQNLCFELGEELTIKQD